jgi:hypothetical protein
MKSLVSFPHFHQIYESTELFPMFANRAMPESRPEYRQTIEWLCLAENSNDPLAFLARTGGEKVTDKFEIFCYPELDKKGDYNLHFFPHGLRYVPDNSIERIGKTEKGEKVYLARAFQNPFDKNALQLQTRDNHIVGYCPSYFLDDMNEIVEEGAEIEVCVERVNDENAPLQFRFLCRLTVPQIANYHPFSSRSYEPIVSLARVTEDSSLAFA